MFNTMSIHGNYYQMVIIDVKTKYVWDYYLETKDQVFEKIQEWLEKGIKLLRGRDRSGFEIVLFSNMREAKSNRVEELCGQHGVRRETTTRYSPAHNAFVERWSRTNAEMSRCQMLQYGTDKTYWGE
jgi:transposase InsO family protein